MHPHVRFSLPSKFMSKNLRNWSKDSSTDKSLLISVCRRIISKKIEQIIISRYLPPFVLQRTLLCPLSKFRTLRPPCHQHVPPPKINVFKTFLFVFFFFRSTSCRHGSNILYVAFNSSFQSCSPVLCFQLHDWPNIIISDMMWHYTSQVA